ncbi:hypothetical protein HUJ04_010458 [Dendroctonus ponderosae]|nr:hypothetical protein HUJ04_013536 [Dendroctonus ponderosae]KAH1020864.1 hypothetical protein HUJ04_010456 [Dendroctonus ponderosae]KAH1020866.1 hypothetical protein HUJ04_010458 [Dendroctonus ponderosae]
MLAIALQQQPANEGIEYKEELGRIVGGAQTDITLYPYQISLQLYYRHRCGGAIISDDGL